MDTYLEEIRCLHEERDRIELAIVNEILSKKVGHKDKLDSEHRQKALLDRYRKCSNVLCDLYKQNSFEREQNLSGAFNQFYISLKKVKDFYNKHSNEQVVTMASEFEEIEVARLMSLGIKANRDQADNLKANISDDGDETLTKDGEIERLTKGLPSSDLVDVVDVPVAPETSTLVKLDKLVEFTDEEGYGRYLDLTKCHSAYLQVIKKDDVKPNYLTFLDKFDLFHELDRDRKMNSTYKSYLEGMLAYFRDYSQRAKPLFDYQDMEAKIHERFLEQWNERTFPGWFTDADRIQINAIPMIELELYKSYEQLMDLGLDCLKKELQVRGLKCGGTLEERAKRLWSIRGKSQNEIDDNIRAVPMTDKKGKRKTTIEPFTIASIEAKLSMYAEYFNDQRLATIENVQRKQARTADERNESDDDLSDVDDEENDKNDVIYNPKNLPLGWDGKPIPYWLYKLHGLNLTFTCEICGNATYKGPKTFQRHFAEWRHAHGMRCLGIPNTAHFANINKIQDAIKLWEKLKSEKQRVKFVAPNDEEFEDSQGNVVNKKTYEDLKRQGLL